MPEPLPQLQLTAFPIFTTNAEGEARLCGSRCPDCGRITFPPAAACSGCGGVAVEPVALSATGTLYSYSVLHVGARGWPAPYILAYVDLPEKVRVFGHVDADPAALALDMKVAITPCAPVTNPEGQEVRAFMFRPAN